MRLIDHQHYLYLRIDIQQSLHEEAVRYLILLAFVVFEPRAVIKRQVFDYHLIRHRSLGVFLVPNFDDIVGTVKDGLEAVVADSHLGAGEEGHDGTFADSGVSDDDDGLVAVGVLGDARDAVFDHFSDF